MLPWNERMKNRPLLSICIPTYNRSQYLDKAIESIVSDPVFLLGEVELVISDNASIDDTEIIVHKYSDKFSNIIYSKNSVNIVDKNLPTVIALANGVFCKLYNDTIILSPGGLTYIIECIKSNIECRPVLYFSNKNVGPGNTVEVYSSLDDFILATSYWPTWIASFGIWSEDFMNLADKFNGTELRLWQTVILYSVINDKKSVFVYNKKIIDIQPVDKKGGYNLFDVFAINYLNIVMNFFNLGIISKNTYNFVKSDLFHNFLIPWYYNTVVEKNNFIYQLSGIENAIRVHYSSMHFSLMKYIAILYSFKTFAIKMWRSKIIDPKA